MEVKTVAISYDAAVFCLDCATVDLGTAKMDRILRGDGAPSAADYGASAAADWPKDVEGNYIIPVTDQEEQVEDLHCAGCGVLIVQGVGEPRVDPEATPQDMAADAYAFYRVRVQAFVRALAVAGQYPFDILRGDLPGFLHDLDTKGVRVILETRAYISRNEWLAVITQYREEYPTPTYRQTVQLPREAEERYERGPLPGLVQATLKSHLNVWYGYDEDDRPTPLTALIADLQRAIKEAEELRDHQHHWNGSDYCDICGMDGRA